MICKQLQWSHMRTVCVRAVLTFAVQTEELYSVNLCQPSLVRCQSRWRHRLYRHPASSSFWLTASWRSTPLNWVYRRYQTPARTLRKITLMVAVIAENGNNDVSRGCGWPVGWRIMFTMILPSLTNKVTDWLIVVYECMIFSIQLWN